MRYYLLITDILGVLTVLALLASAVLLAGLLVPALGRRVSSVLGGGMRAAVAAWIVAATAMSGSLYLSGIGFPPCHLCWYQRIAMYPLVLVLGMGILTRDPRLWRYALPLPVVGLPISIYHVMIQWRPTLHVVECDPNIPCTGRYFQIYGFITIPFMAGTAFLLIACLMIWFRRSQDGLRTESQAPATG